jgi:hypothetical protein
LGYSVGHGSPPACAITRIVDESQALWGQNNVAMYGPGLGNALLIEVAYYNYVPMLPIVFQQHPQLEHELSLLSDPNFLEAAALGITQGIERYIASR